MTKHSSDPKTAHPLPLGSRITRLAEGLVGAAFADPPRVPQEAVQDAIRSRRLRYRYFPHVLFGEPAWDMLLELLSAEIQDRQVTVLDLCEAAGTPGTTTLRWLSSMESEGLLIRRRDPTDSTSELIELEPTASAALRQYFHELSKSD